jgi:serine/threonine protein kinase
MDGEESIYLNHLTKLGKGSYGIVYKGMIHNQSVAIKRNLVDDSINGLGSIRELDLMLRLKHPNILSITHILYGQPFPKEKLENEIKDDQLHFVFEIGLYDLHKLIYQYQVNQNFLFKMMIDILLGVEYMHQRSVIHRDIKPSNIIIFKNNNTFQAKLCDFGLSKPFCFQGKQSPRIMTSCYRAPEVIQGLPYDEKIDVWSVGCVFYEMICRKRLIVPIIEDNEQLAEEVNKMLTSNYYWSTLPSEATTQFKHLLSKLLEVNPSERVSAKEALSDSYFDSMRTYIETIQQRYQHVGAKNRIIKISSRKERVAFCQLFQQSLQQDYSQSWYKHRIYFLAIDLMERYLLWCEKTNEPILNHTKIKLMYYVMMYISVKYFTSTNTIPYFETFSRGEFKDCTEEEMLLIEKVLHYKVYRVTVYDYHSKKTLSTDKIKQLFTNLLFEPEKINGKRLDQV